MNKEKFLVESIVQDLTEKLSNQNNIDYDEAMNIIYSSVLFEKLSDTLTGLYLEGSDYLFELLKDEIGNLAFIQNEI